MDDNFICLQFLDQTLRRNITIKLKAKWYTKLTCPKKYMGNDNAVYSRLNGHKYTKDASTAYINLRKMKNINWILRKQKYKLRRTISTRGFLILIRSYLQISNN